MTTAVDRLRPRRRITGMSALLLPFTTGGEIDWPGWRGLLERTVAAGLVPAVNMDTGFGAVLDPATRRRVLDEAGAVTSGEFVAGAYVDDAPGAALDADAYRRAAAEIGELDGTPIVFPSYGLRDAPDAELVRCFGTLGDACSRFFAFELGEMFSPAGRIFTLQTFGALLEVPQCAGAKHSSLDRQQEWERLDLRDKVRPDFLVLTGNDLAIDMVMYGSDYLLGLSAFAPDAFGQRDRYWEAGDDRFYELNDVLQYLGAFAFRAPTPGYRHDAAMFLRKRGWVAHDGTHPSSPRRPDSDGPVLDGIRERLCELVETRDDQTRDD